MSHLLSWLVLLSGFLFHGDLHQRISDLSDTIEAHPDSLDLYLIRGELYLLDESFPQAHQDFLFCRHAGMVSVRLYIGLSQSFAFYSLPDSALQSIDRALTLDPVSVQALEWKARLLLTTEAYCASGEVFDQLMQLTSSPSPALYIDASDAWDRCGRAGSDEKAIGEITNGLERLGSLHVLEKKMVDLFLRQGKLDLAIAAQSRVVDHTANPARARFDRAKIKYKAGDNAGAEEDLRLAVRFLDQLPAYKSDTPAMQRLRKEILTFISEDCPAK